jgi:hypothetical protein
MSNTVPYEVLAAPFTVYVAPVGTTFPDVGDAETDPSFVSWTKIGTSGPLNYDSDAGVTVEHPQSTNPWRSLGDSGSRKIFRSEEDCKVSLQLADVTAEQYRNAVNSNTVTDQAGVAGISAPQRRLGLSRGFTVATMAVLIRAGTSPYGADWNMQYEIPRAAQTGSPQVVYKKDRPALLNLEWMALVDSTAANEDERFGRLVVQDGNDS